jgi:hypothetical protein
MDKLSILNNALVATGNDPVNVLNDGSDEYTVANTAFDRWLDFLVARHSWSFATTTELLVRVSDADNKSRRFNQNGFRLPANTLHVKEVLWDIYPLTEYEIMGTVLSCNYDSAVYAKVVKPISEELLHPMATEILTLYVESGCYSGLNEDPASARSKKQEAEMLLMETRSHVDQQNPARNTYKSSIRAARQSRRV